MMRPTIRTPESLARDLPSSMTAVRRCLRVFIGASLLIAQLVGLSIATDAGAVPLQVKGICLAYYAQITPVSSATLQQQANATTAYIQNLGANYVQLSIPVYTQSISSNSVYTGNAPTNPDQRTPTVSETSMLITTLQAAGISVDLRPVINEANLPSPLWRGQLAPTNRSAWFASYQSTIAPYVRLAQKDHVAQFTLSTELMSLNADPHWNSVVAWTTAHFSGQLVWNPSLNGYLDGFTHPGTSTQIDFYPDVVVPDTATVSQLVAGWQSVYSSLGSSIAQLRPALASTTTIGEAGILAQDGTYPTPWEHTATGAFNQKIQANWLTAACQFAKRNGMQGIFFHSMYFPGPPPSTSTPTPNDPTSFQPLAIQAIQTCFNG